MCVCVCVINVLVGEGEKIHRGLYMLVYCPCKYVCMQAGVLPCFHVYFCADTQLGVITDSSQCVQSYCVCVCVREFHRLQHSQSIISTESRGRKIRENKREKKQDRKRKKNIKKNHRSSKCS